MTRARRRSRPVSDGEEQPACRHRWVTAIPIETERRVYFVAMLILAGWYLVDRLQ